MDWWLLSHQGHEDFGPKFGVPVFGEMHSAACGMAPERHMMA